MLVEAGIGPALWSLAESAQVPVELDEFTVERFSEAVERAVFVVASEGVEAAWRLRSSHVIVRLFRESERLILELEGAGPGPFEHLADRVGALGGSFTNEDGLIRSEIPCE